MAAFETLLVATDFSALSDSAISSATALADALGVSRLHVVYVAHAGAAPDQKGQWERQLERLEVTASMPVTREMRSGDPADELADAAEAIDADLLVVSSHGYGGIARALIGSVTSRLIRHATRPVLVVGVDRTIKRRPKHIMAAVDDTPVSRAVLAQAFGLLARGGQVRAVTLLEPAETAEDDGLLPRYHSPEEIAAADEQRRKQIARTAASLAATANVEVEVEHLNHESPENAILEAAIAEPTDLVIVGTSDHSLLERLFAGSTAGGVAARCASPVLVVPGAVPAPTTILEPAPEA